VDSRVPTRLDVYLILDSYGTHKTPLSQRWLVKRPRFHLHFTPTVASWTNLVERRFATEKQLRRDAFRSTREMEEVIRDDLNTYNREPIPFVWPKPPTKSWRTSPDFVDEL